MPRIFLNPIIYWKHVFDIESLSSKRMRTEVRKRISLKTFKIIH